jgi:hypothetical protein
VEHEPEPALTTITVGPIEMKVPTEVSLSGAARLLGVDHKTAKKYLTAGLLEWRDIAPPGSTQPTFRVKLDSVTRIRYAYRVGSPAPAPAKSLRTSTRVVSKPPQYQHVKIWGR